MTKENRPIPPALLRLLEKPWRGADDGYSSFEAVWNDDIEGDDRRLLRRCYAFNFVITT